jgi:hypothetical protein
VALKLTRESLLAITSVARADGMLRQNEAAAVRHAAESCGLVGDDLAAVDAAAREGVALETIDLGGLSGWEKALTYAIACWLSRVDGVVNADELKHLRQLRTQLGLPKAQLDAAASAAFDVACLPGTQRPDKYDFAELVGRLRVKLPSLVPAPTE